MFIQKEHDLNLNNSKKNNSRIITYSKLLVTKIKHSKRLQSKKTKGEIKTSFNFAVILCICVQKRHLKSESHLPKKIYLLH